MNLTSCCRGPVDGKTHLDGLKNLSRIYRADREQRNLARWIEEAVKIPSRRNPEISMDRESIEMLSRRQKAQEFCSKDSGPIEDSIKVDERKLNRNESVGDLSRSSQAWRKGVLRKEKHIEMNATSKLLKKRSNQHVKLSKHLSTYMQSIHRSKTHTHTHTTSLTNFIFQIQVKIV